MLMKVILTYWSNSLAAIPDIIRRYLIITLRLFGHTQHKVAHTSSISLAC